MEFSYENIDIVLKELKLLDMHRGTRYVEAFNNLVDAVGYTEKLTFMNWRTHKQNKLRVVYEKVKLNEKSIQSYINRVMYRMSKNLPIEDTPMYIWRRIYSWSKGKYGWYSSTLNLLEYNKEWFLASVHSSDETFILDNFNEYDKLRGI